VLEDVRELTQRAQSRARENPKVARMTYFMCMPP